MNDSVEELIQQLVRADMRAMTAYHVPSAEGMLKLDAMENPFPWPGALPETLQQQWFEKLKTVTANRYPDPGSASVITALRQAFNLPADCDVLLGNGSDELIQLLIQSVATERATVMAPEPSFVMYKVLADINRVNFLGVTLTKNFELDMPAVLAAIKDYRPQLLFLACPNNPTGNCWPLQQIETVIEAMPGLVVIDEAYTAFTEQTALPLLAKYNNVVVMRTLSKIGLAGLRLGFLVAKPEWVKEFNKVRMPYNINVLTQASVEFALQHFDLLKQQTEYLKQQRQEMIQKLSQLEDIEVFPSEANFLLFRSLTGKAEQIFIELKAQGVLIKSLNNNHPLLRESLRVTVGTEKENQKFIETLKAIVV